MKTTSGIICFTDIKGSTQLTVDKGHEGYFPLLKEHLRLGKALAKIHDGDYIKNVGDAHVIRFRTIEDSLAFSTQLQECCAVSRVRSAERLEVRIGLGFGAFGNDDGDVFGDGVNFAARVEAAALPGEVRCNSEFFEHAKTVMSVDVAEHFFKSAGPVELKGKGSQELYTFEWSNFARVRPSVSIAKLAYEQLRTASIELSNVTEGDIQNPGWIVWPVVPRDIATAIHRGQLEMIRVLQFLGWKTRLLISDCGGESEVSDRDLSTFEQRLRKYAAGRGIQIDHVDVMSRLYDPAYEKYAELQQTFRDVTRSMNVSQLLQMNTKTYSKEVTEAISEKTALTYLRPPLTLAAVLHLVSKLSGKSLIVSGQDEKRQWEQLFNIGGSYEKFGLMMIPILNVDKRHQMQQKKQFPIWHSEVDLREKLREEKSNLAWWLSQLFCVLPTFPEKHTLLGERQINHSDISPDLQCDLIPEGKEGELVDAVWEMLNPAM